MKIKIFKAFVDSYRESMTLYADSLLKALQKTMNGSGRAEAFFPSIAFSKPRLLRYLSQYGIYQIAAPFAQGDVNHIIDHSYAHLLYTLDPRRTVVTFHDAIWLKVRHGACEAEPSRGLRWIRAYNLKALGRAARIICDSEASRKALLRYLEYPVKKTEVIAPGLQEAFLNAPGIRETSHPEFGNGPFLLHVGHTQSYKNIPALFHVLAVLKKMGRQINLLKVGTPFSPEQEQEAKRLGVWEHVLHLGKIEEKKLPGIYRSADVLLMPSFDEGFGFPALEAMASGLPVVASNRGSLPELLQDCGILTEPDDYEGMAKAVCAILDQPNLRASLIERGKKRAALFTWNKTAEKILEVYRKVNQSRHAV